MSIEQFDGDAKTSGVVAALDRDGAVVVRDQIDAATAGAIKDEVRGCDESSMLLGNSPSAIELLIHPRVLEVADAVLLRACAGYQLGWADVIENPAGGKSQELRADNTIYPMRFPGVEWQISATWALNDVGEENGCPTLIAGSHRGDRTRLPDEADMQCVPMSNGSLLLCMGWTLHGWGANDSEKSSTFMVCRYSLGWLRSEVNHIISIPGETIASYPEQIRRLVGYESQDTGRPG